jgi:hypothetical protein
MLQTTIGFTKKGSSALVVPDDAPKAKIQRLVVATYASVEDRVAALERAGMRVKVFAFSACPPSFQFASLEHACEFHGAIPGAHFNVDEQAFNPGADETCGIFVYAFEVADAVIKNRKQAVVLTSKKGGDAPKLVGALASAIVKRRFSRTEATKLLGGTSGMLLKESTPAKRIFDLFASGSCKSALEPALLGLEIYRKIE